jgi:hypothetical protein
MNRLPPLTDTELHGTLLNALGTARAAYLTLSINEELAPGLADQFAQQARDCRALIEKLEEESTDA